MKAGHVPNLSKTCSCNLPELRRISSSQCGGWPNGFSPSRNHFHYKCLNRAARMLSGKSKAASHNDRQRKAANADLGIGADTKAEYAEYAK